MCQCGVQLENDPWPREDFPALEDHKSFRVFDMLEKQTQVLEVVCIGKGGKGAGRKVVTQCASVNEQREEKFTNSEC